MQIHPARTRPPTHRQIRPPVRELNHRNTPLNNKHQTRGHESKRPSEEESKTLPNAARTQLTQLTTNQTNAPKNQRRFQTKKFKTKKQNEGADILEGQTGDRPRGAVFAPRRSAHQVLGDRVCRPISFAYGALMVH
jgi:hypothetical protein